MDESLRAALALHHAGDLTAAGARYRDLIAQNPAQVDALHMLGLLHHQLGESSEALEWLDRALQIAPGAANVLANRAAVQMARAQPALAEADARAAIASDPQAFAAWLNLGLALALLDRGGDATRALRRASALRPQHAIALLQWFRAAATSGQTAGIATRLRSALPSLASERALALETAAALEQAGQSNAALALLARLRADLPNDAQVAARCEIEILYRHAGELEYHRRSDEAMDTAARVLARAPRHRGASLLRAELARERGEIDSALGEYDELLAMHPQDSIAASSHLIALQHAPEVEAAALSRAHRRWGAQHASPTAPAWIPAQPYADPEKPLRVGWLSPRWSAGVVGTFFSAAFEALDRTRAQHFLYDNGSVEDAVNARFHAAAAGWCQVDELDDGQLCERIRADRIDVLIELCGHGPGNRLRALAARPAPVQISWLDYFHSSGVEAIDFMFSDRCLSPPELEKYYTERLLYLPSGRVCYAPDVTWPAARPRKSGPRFGCFNRLAKINDVVLDAWSRILAANPATVLCLKASAFDDMQMRARFIARCANHAIDAGRLELTGYGTHAETLAAYADIDIALDTYPFSGCATSCDALAMGVPVVSRYGDTMASRQTLSLLETLGLSDCIAVDAHDYVDRVQALVDDVRRRETLRTALPDQMQALLGNVRRHADELSVAIRQAWQVWCGA